MNHHIRTAQGLIRWAKNSPTRIQAADRQVFAMQSNSNVNTLPAKKRRKLGLLPPAPQFVWSNRAMRDKAKLNEKHGEL